MSFFDMRVSPVAREVTNSVVVFATIQCQCLISDDCEIAYKFSDAYQALVLGMLRMFDDESWPLAIGYPQESATRDLL